MSIQAAPAVVLPSDQDATGRTLGEAEIAAVTEALRSGTLTSTKGEHVKRLEKRFAELIGMKHCHAAASGSAAIHCAVAVIDPEPGDEIVTTAITDMGALTPIIYQGAIPVFADVDPHTLNVTAKTIEAALSPRTKAIIATPLFGNPCDMSGIMALARERKIPVIEDCSQSFLASHAGRPVGSWGDLGVFSLQQGKHITCGEGGLVVTNNAEYARRVFLFVNKAWGYGDAKPDHYFLALNYRMTELQGAVADAQLDKLSWSADRRQEMADKLSDLLEGVPGLTLPRPRSGDRHTYWKYCPIVDGNVIPGGAVALAGKLKAVGIASAPRYIQKPAFMCEVFAQQRTFGASRWPFTLARPEAVDYRREKFPGTFAALEGVLVLPWNERYQPEHVEYIAHHVRASVDSLLSDGK